MQTVEARLQGRQAKLPLSVPHLQPREAPREAAAAADQHLKEAAGGFCHWAQLQLLYWNGHFEMKPVLTWTLIWCTEMDLFLVGM